MEFKNKTILPLIVISVMLFLAMLFGIVYYFARNRGFVVAIQYFIIILSVFIVIGIIVGILIYLFKRQRVDMVYINKQRILQACNLSRPSHKQAMFLKGTHELESRFVGYITGIARIRSEPKRELKVEGKQSYYQEIPKTEKFLTFISFKRNLGFLGWFEQVKLFCGVDGDFSHLSGDIVYLKDMTFAPPLYDIFFLQRHYKDTEKIDEPIARSIYRYQLQENLKEIKNLVDEYLAISPQHQKSLEKSRLAEIKRSVGDDGQTKPAG